MAIVVKAGTSSAEIVGTSTSLHLVAELLQQRRGVAGGVDAVGGGGDAERGLGHQPDPQPPGLALPSSSANGRAGGIALFQASGSGPAMASRTVGGVGHGAGGDALDHGAHPVLGTARHPAAAGLEADQAAVGGGDADRAAAVVGVGDREHAAGDCGSGTTRGAAGRAARVPGVAADAVAGVLGDGDRAELGRVGAAAEDEAGALQGLDDQLALLARLPRGAPLEP